MVKRLQLGSLITLLILLVLVAPASATAPAGVSGQYWLTEPPANLQMRPAGNNCIIDVDMTYPFTGDLIGTAVAHFRVVSHGPCENNMPFSYDESLKAKGTFTGEVLGQAGTFDFIYEGKGWPAAPGEEALDVRIVILSGTGGLEGLHGMLDVTYVMGDAFDSYEGQVHFDP